MDCLVICCHTCHCRMVLISNVAAMHLLVALVAATVMKAQHSRRVARTEDLLKFWLHDRYTVYYGIHLPTNVTLWYVVVVPCRTCLYFKWRCFLLFLPATPCANRPDRGDPAERGLDEELKKKAELEKLLNLQKEMSNMSNRFNRWGSREGWKTLDVNDIQTSPAAPWFWCFMLQ